MPSSVDLCTIAQVKVELETTSTERDSLIPTYITDASTEIMRQLEREFAPATASATRRMRIDPRKTVDGSILLNLRTYDVRTVTAMSLHPESTSPVALTEGTDFVLWPQSPDAVYTHILFSNRLTSRLQSPSLLYFGFALVDITGAWGWAAVPIDVQEACVQTVCSWLRRDFPAPSMATFTEQGDPIAPVRTSTYSIPPVAWRKLNSYRRGLGVI